MTENVESIILKKLEEYGDSFIEENCKKNKKKEKTGEKHESKETRTDKTSSQSGIESHTLLSERQKKKRRKKKRKDLKEGKVDGDTEDVSKPQLSGHEKRLKEMSEQLGLSEFKSEMERRTNTDEVKTEKKNEPEVIVFTSHKKSAKAAQKAQENPKGIDFNMRQARFDVQKLGIKGFQGDKKEEAMTAMLIKLGAKPPKNKYVNYKEYQENRKKEVLAEKEEIEKARELGNKVPVPKANRGKKRSHDKNGVGLLDGQMGMWKSGVQILKKDDVKKFKKTHLK